MIISLDPELLQRLTRLDDPRTTAVAEQLDDNLAAAVRHTALMRRLFYTAVLVVALYGTATGAVTAFDLPWWIAISGIFALELGGVTFLSNADVRRRLGEHATASRLLGALIAATAATFNVATHSSRLLGGFYALMSALGFVSWWLDVENKRRDRLRAKGLLPAPTPKYELSHWIRHPMITAQARGLAKAHPQLGLYGSLQAARIIRRREQRDAALADALRTRIRAAAGKQMADIAVLTYDMDEVAHRLRTNADYDGLTALLGSELTAEHMLHGRDDRAAIAARAFLARQAQTTLPLGATAADHDEPPTSADLGEITDNVTEPQGTADHNGSAAEDATRQATLAVDRRWPPTGAAVNGRAVFHRSGAWPSLLPASPSNAGSITATVEEEPENSRGLDQADAPPPAPPATTTTGAFGAGSRPPQRRVRVNVVGEPAILNAAGQPVRGLRAKSTELLVFLVVRRDGAALADILDTIWPDITRQKANQRLSTCLSNLRGILRDILGATDLETATSPRPEPIVNTGGHYHLNPTIVTADWWQLLDDQHTGTPSATDAAVNAARARIANDYDYPWLDTEPDRPSGRVEGQPWGHK
ncbi:hypothetical protein [Dactylosporangium darangshiense]|uniref:Bacterial transcriptional activator domain-containing protein n=1 Tax=Dactylosporangium darangshiense TaxID=579108 RepID=A0ABP8DMX0_9ACTN